MSIYILYPPCNFSIFLYMNVSDIYIEIQTDSTDEHLRKITLLCIGSYRRQIKTNIYTHPLTTG